jgi:hypothetical protein
MNSFNMITLHMLLLDERDVLVDRAWFELGKKGLHPNASISKCLEVGTMGLHQCPQVFKFRAFSAE